MDRNQISNVIVLNRSKERSRTRIEKEVDARPESELVERAALRSVTSDLRVSIIGNQEKEDEVT